MLRFLEALFFLLSLRFVSCPAPDFSTARLRDIRLTHAFRGLEDSEDPYISFDEEGPDTFPAYGLHPGSNVSIPYDKLFPASLAAPMAVTATARIVDGSSSGYLFGIVDPNNKVVQFGLQVSPEGGTSHVSLYLGDSFTPVASFTAPSNFASWTQVGLAVTNTSVAMYFNCELSATVPLSKPPRVDFLPGSTLYIGQAGPVLGGNLDGVRK